MNDKCFYIEGNYLYLEQALVVYNGIPIFFLCKSGKQYYTALCTNIEEMTYIVVETPALEIYKLLHGRVAMRDVILKADRYWQVVSAEDMLQDNVKCSAIDTLDQSQLPEAGAYYKVLSDDIKAYVQTFDSEFLSAKSFSTTLEEMVHKLEMAMAFYEEHIDVYKSITICTLGSVLATQRPFTGNLGGSYKPYAKMKSILNHDSESEDWTVGQMMRQSA